MAEVVKCGFIADPTILELVEAAPEQRRWTRRRPLVAELIAKGIAVKAATVEGDLRETGARWRDRPRGAQLRPHPRPRARAGRTASGCATARRSPSAWCSSPSWRTAAGRIDADLLARHRSILGIARPADHGRHGLRRAAGGRCAWTRRPAATSSGSSCSTAWPSRRSSPAPTSSCCARRTRPFTHERTHGRAARRPPAPCRRRRRRARRRRPAGDDARQRPVPHRLHRLERRPACWPPTAPAPS